jgi:hypothetical protein
MCRWCFPQHFHVSNCSIFFGGCHTVCQTVNSKMFQSVNLVDMAASLFISCSTSRAIVVPLFLLETLLAASDSNRIPPVLHWNITPPQHSERGRYHPQHLLRLLLAACHLAHLEKRIVWSSHKYMDTLYIYIHYLFFGRERDREMD